MADNRPWNLESFLDSLIFELDKAQDALALKGINRPLTYTVKDLALELQIFPVFTGDSIMFATARPGESGASRVSIQLGSISDRQIRETTKTPISKDDVTVEAIEGLDEQTKKTLTRIGVKTAKDLERMEQRKVDIGSVAGKKVDYQKLAAQIAKSRRISNRPEVKSLRLERDQDGYLLALSGANLATGDDPDSEYPVALVNRRRAPVVTASSQEIQLSLGEADLRSGPNDLMIALDRYSIIRLEINA